VFPPVSAGCLAHVGGGRSVLRHRAVRTARRAGGDRGAAAPRVRAGFRGAARRRSLAVRAVAGGHGSPGFARGGEEAGARLVFSGRVLRRGASAFNVKERAMKKTAVV